MQKEGNEMVILLTMGVIYVTTIYFFLLQSYGGYLTVGVPFWVLVNSLNGKWCLHTSITTLLFYLLLLLLLIYIYFLTHCFIYFILLIFYFT